MEALGHASTWETHCFLPGGCGQQGLFGHTNGFGDFVLFDALGWPWPIHECYQRRFQLGSETDVVRIGSTSSIRSVNHHHHHSEDSIFEVIADLEKHRAGISVIGTVTNVEKGFIGKSPLFGNLSTRQKSEIVGTLGGRRSHIVVAAGDGHEYGVFVDFDKYPLGFRDTPGCICRRTGDALQV